MAYKRFTASAKQLQPDARYGSRLASKFINCLMLDGKKSVAKRVFYDALDVVGKKVKDQSPIETFETALENIKPQIEVRSRRVGGANYQVPVQVNPKRKQSLAIRWLFGRDPRQERAPAECPASPTSSSRRITARARRCRPARTCIAWLDAEQGVRPLRLGPA